MIKATIFSSPKPFRDPHINIIQRNALASWMALGSEIEVILIGDEEGLADAAAEMGARHIGDVARNQNGTPLLSAIFKLAQLASSSSIMAYFNADIIILPEFLQVVQDVHQRFKRYLLVGSRIDLDLQESWSFGAAWPVQMRALIEQQGTRHKPSGSDYFVFPRGEFLNLPQFALGRAGWDNWMIYSGRRAQIPVIDASNVITVVHQNHDYAHLPGGKPHYRHPESDRNVELAGGRETIFTLGDTDWVINNGVIRRKRWFERRFPRSLESWFYSRLGPGRTARLVWLLFHPSLVMRALKGYFRWSK